jgi:hypothetical protein
MNERIQELAEQAGWDNHHAQFDTRIEKFAELIVRECVKVMYDDAIERRVTPDIDKTPTHYVVAVLEHFGVRS